MSKCPYCGHAYIPGEDACTKCGQSLVFLSKLVAQTPLEKSILKDNVAELAPREPMLVHRDTPVGEVIRRLVNWGIGSVLIVDSNEQLVGIFTERDALLRIGAGIAGVAEVAVGEFMTPNPTTIADVERIAQAMQKMAQGGLRHLPVLHDGRITGVISVRDILRFCSEKLLQEQS